MKKKSEKSPRDVLLGSVLGLERAMAEALVSYEEGGSSAGTYLREDVESMQRRVRKIKYLASQLKASP